MAIYILLHGETTAIHKLLHGDAAAIHIAFWLKIACDERPAPCMARLPPPKAPPVSLMLRIAMVTRPPATPSAPISHRPAPCTVGASSSIRIVRSGTVLEVRTLGGGLLLEWPLAEDTDVSTLSLAFTIYVARTLGVPRQCLSMTWLLPPSVAGLAPTATVVPITCTVSDLDELFWTEVDTECFCCGDPCVL